MRLKLPTLEFSPGRIMCLHIPHGFNTAGDVFQQELLHLAHRQAKTAVLCQPAGFESRVARSGWVRRATGWFSRITNRQPTRRGLVAQTSTDWLSHAAGVSNEESVRIISELGERVAEELDFNAGTPRCLLGIAAALVQKPEVIIYSTIALDLQGCWKVHEYVVAKCTPLCAIHISHPGQHGDGTPHPRVCPSGAQCITLIAVD
jgi:hypothetical protein